jgi:hypothetical protein
MFLQSKEMDAMVEILNPESLFNPVEDTVSARVQEGQEEQDPRPMKKDTLIFPSGESLPRCWLDPNYRTA